MSDIRIGDRSIFPDAAFVAGAGVPFEVQLGMPTGSVRGHVRNSASQWAAGAWVLAAPERARRANLLFYKMNVTSFDGEFALLGLAPGEYQLFAWSGPPFRDVSEDPALLAPYESRSVTVRVNPGTTTEMNLRLIQ